MCELPRVQTSELGPSAALEGAAAAATAAMQAGTATPAATMKLQQPRKSDTSQPDQKQLPAQPPANGNVQDMLQQQQQPQHPPMATVPAPAAVPAVAAAAPNSSRPKSSAGRRLGSLSSNRPLSAAAFGLPSSGMQSPAVRPQSQQLLSNTCSTLPPGAANGSGGGGSSGSKRLRGLLSPATQQSGSKPLAGALLSPSQAAAAAAMGAHSNGSVGLAGSPNLHEQQHQQQAVVGSLRQQGVCLQLELPPPGFQEATAQRCASPAPCADSAAALACASPAAAVQQQQAPAADRQRSPSPAAAAGVLGSRLKRSGTPEAAAAAGNSSAAVSAVGVSSQGLRPTKRVRFNDAVQVFVLPPKTADEADLTAAAAGREGSPRLEDPDPVMSDYQRQLQQQHGQWIRSGARPLSRRQAAKLRKEQAAAAAAAAAVAAITGDGAQGSSSGSEAAAAAAAAAGGGQSDASNGSRGEAAAGSSSSSRKQAGRKPQKRSRGGSTGAAPAASSAAAAAAGGYGIDADDAFDLGSEADFSFDYDAAAEFSPWHKQQRPHYGAPLVKGSPEAQQVESMLRDEEGLDESIVTALMSYLHKEARAPSCEILQSRVQRFKSVIAPYREPSMLHWLRRNPRLLLMSASTLAGNISGLLSVLTPGLMLPDAAAELLSKCPSLVARTPAGVQAKIVMMGEVLGPAAVAPLLTRLPVILTLGGPRFKETVEIVTSMIADPGPMGVLLKARLALEVGHLQQQPQQPADQRQQQQADQHQEKEPAQQDVQAELHGLPQQQPQPTSDQQQQQQQQQNQLPADQQPLPTQQQQQQQQQQQAADQQPQPPQPIDLQQQPANQQQPGNQQQQQENRVSPAVLALLMGFPAVFIKPTDRVRDQFARFQLVLASWIQHGGSVGMSTAASAAGGAAAGGAAADGAAAGGAASGAAASGAAAGAAAAPSAGTDATATADAAGAEAANSAGAEVTEGADAAAGADAPAAADAAAGADTPAAAAGAVAPAAVDVAAGAVAPAAVDVAAGTDAPATADAAGAEAANSAGFEAAKVAEAAGADAPAAAADADAPTAAAGADAPAAAAGADAAAVTDTLAAACADAPAAADAAAGGSTGLSDQWLHDSGALNLGLATIMSPVMLSDVLFLLMEHRAEYLLQQQLQAQVRVWNIHGSNGKNFEERHPGFAAWREEAKGVPAAVTLAAGTTGGSNTSRKRNRAKKAA